MKKYCLFLLFIIPFTLQLNAQELSKNQTDTTFSIRNNKKNIVFFETFFVTLSANYERLIPIGKRTGFIIGGGIILVNDFFANEINLFPVLKSSIIYGGPKHFIELGAFDFSISGFSSHYFAHPLLGYRWYRKMVEFLKLN